MSTPAPPPPPPGEEPPPAPQARAGRAHPFLLYNLARLTVFAIVLGVCYLLGFRGLPLLLVSLLVSGAISFVVLRRLADSAGASFVGAWRRMNTRIDERSRSEDDQDPS